MRGLAGKVCVITGGARGLGAAIARRLQADGAVVALWDADAGAVEWAAAGMGAHAEVMDVTDAESATSDARKSASSADSGRARKSTSLVPSETRANLA